jgi:ATP-dependent DNA helicase RecQ
MDALNTPQSRQQSDDPGTDLLTKISDVLKTSFGYDEFRPPQAEIITRLLSGGDCVILMPTGGGKSLCYQLPALILDGCALVISPLISLMKDQVNALNANGIPAAFYNSSQDEDESELVLTGLREGTLKLLYVSPERALSPGFASLLGEIKVSLLAIDEAHCVSSWGHSFRPEYRQLHRLVEQIPGVPVAALTATADRAVRSEIGGLLGMREPEFFISSFDRPNISLSVLPGQQKFRQIQAILGRHLLESGIIYCSSRKACEQLASKLQSAGHRARAYHAGMSAAEREEVHDRFIDGRDPIICATIAFGMGIDKPDIRFVIHHNMPGNLESYYQEIGRAGRDGDPAEAFLFYSYRDVQTQQGFIDELGNPDYRRIQAAKLQRMQEYAESAICRRQVLLSYFSETVDEPCGNCDVCANPPEYFNGSIHAQKALSAVVRSRESLTVSLLVDVLRGAATREVEELGLQRIKTYGVGRDTTAFAWQLYIQQLIQQGILELDYRDHFHLKLTDLSRPVLSGDREVQLISFETIRKRQEELKEQRMTGPTEDRDGPYDEKLFEALRKRRMALARELGKPPYVVFSDASLRDMARKKPRDSMEFMNVHGVGEHKAARYGGDFLEVIDEYLR